MESFFKTLKVEQTSRHRYETRAQAKLDVVDRIELKASTIDNASILRLNIARRAIMRLCKRQRELLYVKTRHGQYAGGTR